MTEGIAEPVPRPLLLLLRRAVLDHAASEHRRVHLPLVHVGVPGAASRVLAVRPEDRLDHTLRTDLVAALLATSRRTAGPHPPLLWLTRAGELDLQDVDAQWLAAARAAYAEAELPLVMVVANRRAWRDPRSGTGRSWQRLRHR